MRTKRMISFLLALVMVLAVVPNFALADNEETQPAEAVTYTVTFDSNGGTAVSPVSVEAGATVAVPQIKRDGFELTGWYTTAVVDGQSVAAEYDFSTPVTSDLTLQAQWSAIVPKNIKMSSKGLMTVLGAPSAADVAKIGETGYATLEAAVAEAQSGNTITLLDDVTLTQNLNVELGSKNVTLDLGGKTLTGRLNLKSGNLTIQNGTVAGRDQQALNVYGSDDSTAENYSVLTIASTATVTADVFGVCVFGKTATTNGYGAVVNIAGTVHTTGTGAEAAVFVSGNLGHKDTTAVASNIVNITGTVTSDKDAAVAANGGATINVQSGAKITGNTGIAIKRGTLNVTGGTITGNGDKNYPGTPNYNGTEMTGAGISMTNTYSEYGPMQVNIYGGTVTSKNADALYKRVADYQADAKYAVSGGTFSSAVPAEYCADGYIPKKNDDGTYGVKQGTYVAQIVRNNEVVASYETLADAITAATAGDTIKLLTNINVKDAIMVGKNVIIDGGNHTITTSANRGFRVNANDVTVTIKNLTIGGSGSNLERAIQVDSEKDGVTLTIDNVTATSTTYTVNICGSVDDLTLNIKDSNLTGWGVVNLWGNNGKVNITGSTLTGINNQTYNADGWNDFGTIVVEGDTTSQTTEHAESYTINVSNSTIAAQSTTGNTQYVLLHNKQSKANTLILTDCEITMGDNCAFYSSAVDDSVTKVKPKAGEKLPDLSEFYYYSSADANGYHTINRPVAWVCDVVNEENEELVIAGKYGTLQEAFNEATNGQWVILLDDVTQDDGILFDKENTEIVFYMNNKTLTVNKGTSVNNRAIKINAGTLQVFGGTIDAVGSGTTSSNGAGCYGAFRVEEKGKLIAESMTLKNYRPWGLNVKVCGGEAVLTNVTIISSYGGGIEVTEKTLGDHSKKGIATLTDCKFTQSGHYDHCSTAISVSGGSKVIVNSGSYTGEYALYVFSSGGEIEVKGGTFEATSQYAIRAEIDTNTYPDYEGGLVITDGNFTGTIYIKTPAYMTISGGYFTADPQNYLAKGYDRKDSNKEGYKWMVGEHVHSFTYDYTKQPTWLWTLIDGKWSVSSTYTGTCSCGETGTETLTATLKKYENQGFVRYTATDEKGNTDIKTFVSTFTVIYGADVKTYLYGKACKLVSNEPVDWYVNEKLRAVGTKTFYFPVTEYARVTTKTPTASTQQPTSSVDVKSSVDVETGKGTMDYHFTWSIPEKSQVVSAVIYRCRDDSEAVKSFDTLKDHPNLRTYDTKMYARNGDFTYTVTGLTPGSKQAIMFHLVYTLYGETFTMDIPIRHVAIPNA